jgi:nitroreductase
MVKIYDKEPTVSKSILFFAIIFVLVSAVLPAQSTDNPGLRPILNNFGARNFAAGAVTRAELDLIIQAGIRAPSASNRQPWHFTVVQSQTLARQLIPQAADGNVLIVVSAAGDGRTNGPVILDCALAAQSMYLAAQALGLGSRLYTGPIDNVNRSFKNELSLPRDHNAVIIVRVGRLPSGVDALSSASPRNNAQQTVTYK